MSALVSPAAFQAALENVRKRSFADPQANRGAKADALKWRILVALEGAVPVLRTEFGLDKVCDLIDRRLRHDQPATSDFDRGYNQAMRDVAALLASQAEPLEGP